MGDKNLPAIPSPFDWTPPHLHSVVWGEGAPDFETPLTEMNQALKKHSEQRRKYIADLKDEWEKPSNNFEREDKHIIIHFDPSLTWRRVDEEGITCFRAWREDLGIDFYDLVRDMNKQGFNITTKHYASVESGEVEAGFHLYKAFCHTLHLHPVNVINFALPLSNPEIMLMVDAFNNLTNYHMNTPHCWTSLRAHIEDWLDINAGYEALEDAYENLENDEDNVIIYAFLEALLVNDGNPLLAYVGIQAYAQLFRLNKLSSIKHCTEEIERQRHISDWHRFEAKASGIALFDGYDEAILDANAVMVKGGEKHHCEEEETLFYSQFLMACRRRKPLLNEPLLREYFASASKYASSQRNKSDYERQIEKMRKQLEAFDKFINSFDDVLTDYNKRQVVLTNTNLASSIGDPSHSLYLKMEDVNKMDLPQSHYHTAPANSGVVKPRGLPKPKT